MNANKVFSLAEVAEHNTDDDCWIAVNGKVYDVTSFLQDHPGGPEVVMETAGTDATDEFEDVGHSKTAREQLKPLLIGKLKDGEGVRLSSGAGSGSGGGLTNGAAGDDSSTMWYLLPLFALVAAVAWKIYSQTDATA